MNFLELATFLLLLASIFSIINLRILKLPQTIGLMVLAIANDRQFKNFCEFSGLYDLCENSKFKTNSSRVKNRKELNKIIGKTILKKTITEWVQGLTKINVPCGIDVFISVSIIVVNYLQ